MSSFKYSIFFIVLFCGSQTNNVNSSSQKTENPLGIHSQDGWKNSLPIKYTISIEMTDTQHQYLKNAMQSWEKAVGKKLFEFEGTDPHKGIDFSDLYEPLKMGLNGHFFDMTWAKSTGKPNSVLATTVWENDSNMPQAILHSSIRYNQEHYIFGDATKDQSQDKKTIVDMQSLCTHELGHFLGLSHVPSTSDSSSIMNPTLKIGEGNINRFISSGDVDRVRSIYGVGDSTQSQEVIK